MSTPLLEEDGRILSAREHWRYRGQERPPFAEVPGANQESVWDFPRPPLIESVAQEMSVWLGDQLIARTTRGKRVMETASAPTYYFPPEDVQVPLTEERGMSICEWKGVAQPLGVGDLSGIAWRYVQMFPAFAELYLWVAFYPTQLKCFIGKERVTPQPGGYYGGWVTEALCGPIKGEPGSSGW